jgi:hypothetical protein
MPYEPATPHLANSDHMMAAYLRDYLGKKITLGTVVGYAGDPVTVERVEAGVLTVVDKRGRRRHFATQHIVTFAPTFAPTTH